MARIHFLERNTANPTPPWIDVPVAPGDTEKIENIVESLFHKQVFGALRVTCATQKLVATARVYSKAAGSGEKDSMGQDFAGVPASFAIGAGEKAQVLGVHQTAPAAVSDYRFNFGFVETTGHTASVRVSAYDETGTFHGSTDVTVRSFSQGQYAFKDRFPAVSTENARLEVAVISGAGRIIAYGSGITNGSQDPTTFEMAYPDAALAENLPAGITGVTAGNGLTGGGASGVVTLDIGFGAGIAVTADQVAIADGGVTTGKLSAAGSANGQVLTSNGSAISWRDPAGPTLPYSGSVADAAVAFGVTNDSTTAGTAAVSGISAHASGWTFGTHAGVWGNSRGGGGVYGTSDLYQGVTGLSNHFTGVHGESLTGDGVHGKTGSATGAGVVGENSSHGNGVAGTSKGDGYAVYGTNTDASGYAGYFDGRGYFSGAVSKPGGGFLIDHPLDPEQKLLNHSFVESPDMKNVYDGMVVLDELGEATITLPDWFEALNRDFRYQLTAIGSPGPDLYVAAEIAGNRFRIAGGKPAMRVSWQVTGIRQDPWAEAHRIPVEQDKPAAELGTYLHPEVYGKPDEAGVERVRNPEMMKKVQESRQARPKLQG
jgi:hypothetical protein